MSNKADHDPVNSDAGQASWWRQRSARQRRVIVLGLLFLLAVIIPGLRAALVDFLVAIVALLAVAGMLGVLAIGFTWRLARRHPAVGVLVGAWLWRRHERKLQVVDARSWPAASAGWYKDPSSWPPPGAQTWRS